MKKTILTLAALSMGVATSQAVVIILDNGGTANLTTGDNLDEISSPTSGIAVVESPGLLINIHAITGDGVGTDLNATTTSLGINAGAAGDDTDGFDALTNESVTISFSETVSITQLDFAGFETGEVFAVGANSIGFADLTSGTTDIYDFASPFILAANTQITFAVTSGAIGIEGMTLEVVPEPSSTALLGLGGLALILRRRK